MVAQPWRDEARTERRLLAGRRTWQRTRPSRRRATRRRTGGRMTTTVSLLDPLTDARWANLLERHPRASVFHSPRWLEALKRSYGFEPIALTTTRRGPLENGLAVCRVRTWMSRRLVSLPFSDHCDLLVDSPDDLSAMLGYLLTEMDHRRSSLELRPRFATLKTLSESAGYYV